MKRALGLLGKVPPWVAIVGTIAGIVYGFCCLIATEVSRPAPNETTGHTYVYEKHRDKRITVVYVKPSFHWISEISRVVAISCLATVYFTLLARVLGTTIRLLIPGSFESANLELARYRQSVGPIGVTAEGLRYVVAWRDLKRRTALPGIALLSFIGTMLAGWAFWPNLPPFVTDELAIALISGSLVLTFATLCWPALFRCPRCGNFYYSKAGEDVVKFCTHCGLPEDSPPTTDVSPDFIKWKKRA